MQRKRAQYRYDKFVMIFRVLIWTTVSITCTKCDDNNENLSQSLLISNFVQQFIRPYIQSLQFKPITPMYRSISESPVEDAIRDVIEKQRPYLQDDDNNADKEQEGDDETTIIEFVPKSEALRTGNELNSEFQTNIAKYEKIKSSIKEALEKEAVSNTTKKLVTKTLDDLIAQVIGNQCTWKSVDYSSAIFRNRNKTKHEISIEEWQDLKKDYLGYIESKKLNRSMELFNEFHTLFSEMIKNTQSLSKNYKVKCQLVKVANNGAKDATRSKTPCSEFKLCSQELHEFLFNFYKALNDTTVSVFKNYAAMYVRDVIADGDESKDAYSVPSILRKIGETADRRVFKIFIQELDKLKVDRLKNKENNAKILREFVKRTIKRDLKHIKKHLAADLAPLKERLFLAVKKDIHINLDVDLGNLETDTKSKICLVFANCNGRLPDTRRTMSYASPKPSDNSLYVKLQVSMDDRIKDRISSVHKKILRNINKKKKHVLHKMEYASKKLNNIINVTRTTVGVSTT